MSRQNLISLACVLRQEIELVDDVQNMSYIRIKDKLLKRFNMSNSEFLQIKSKFQSMLEKIVKSENFDVALENVSSSRHRTSTRSSILSPLAENQDENKRNPAYLFVDLRDYLFEQFENDETSKISYTASKSFLLNRNFSRDALEIAKPILHSFFARLFIIEKYEDAIHMLSESQELRSRIINGRLYLGTSKSTILPTHNFDNQHLNNPIVDIRDIISCTVMKHEKDLTFEINVAYDVIDTIVCQTIGDHFNPSPCYRFRTILTRADPVNGSELRKKLRLLRDRPSLNIDIVNFLEHAISCLEIFKGMKNLSSSVELYRMNVMTVLSELVKVWKQSHDVRQFLLDILGVKRSASVSYSEMKLFQVSLNLSRTKYPMWNSIFIPGTTKSTGVILGQLPEVQHILMLKECANVRSILSVVSDFELRSVNGHQAWRIPGIDQKIINVTDFQGGGGILAIREGADYIESQLQFGRVYVHCKAGRGRSALMIMGWLMKYRSEVVRSPLDAYWTILKNRPHINPDTLITHSKVKECFSYWNIDILGLDKIFGGQAEKGQFVFPDGTIFDLEEWKRAAIGAGFLSSTGYLRARDALYRLFGGTKAAEEMCKRMKPAKNSDLNTKKSRKELWMSHFGIFCPEEIERADSVSVLHRLRDEDASQNTMNAISAFEKEILLPVRRVTRMMKSKPVFETHVTILFTSDSISSSTFGENSSVSLRKAFSARLQLRIWDRLVEQEALKRSISLFRTTTSSNLLKKKKRSSDRIRRHALRTEKTASIVLNVEISSSTRRVYYIKVNPNTLTMNSLHIILQNKFYVQFHRFQDINTFQEVLQRLFLEQKKEKTLSSLQCTFTTTTTEEEEMQDEEVEDEGMKVRIKNIKQQIRHLVRIERFEAAAALCGKNSKLKHAMITNMLCSTQDRHVVKKWCNKLEVSILRAQRALERTNQEINMITMSGLEEILLVDSLSSLEDARNILLPKNIKDGSHFVLGMDCEWKPVRSGQTSSSPVCLIQFATREHVVIFDLCTLDINTNGEYMKLLNEIMMREDVVLVGFALSRDFSMLLASHSGIFEYYTIRKDISLDALWPPTLGDDGSGVRRVSDLDTDAFMNLHQAKIGNPRSVVLLEKLAHLKCIGKSPGHVLNEGLLSLTTKVLNVPIDKTCQLSDWSKRPLSVSQLQYAALDAFVCVKIFDKMCNMNDDSSPSWINALLSEFTLRRKIESRRTTISTTKDTRSEKHVQDYINSSMRTSKKNIKELPRIYHSEDVTSTRVLKTICCKARVRETNQDKFVAVVLPCDSKIKMRVLKKHYDKDNIYTHFCLASPEECIEEFGFEPGTMPAFAHRKHFDTILAKCLYDDDDDNDDDDDKRVIVGGGSKNMICELYLSDLKELTRGCIVRVTSMISGSQKKIKADHVMKVEALPISSNANIWIPTKNLNMGKKFVAGNEVQRLAALLRALGIDAIEYKFKNDENLLRLAEKESRVILTRENSLASTLTRCAIYRLQSNDVKEQVRDVFDHFGLTRQKDAFLSRCSRCNSLGFEGPLNESAIRKIVLPDIIPERILKKTQEFWVCVNNKCRKIFWQGPKSKQAMSTLDEIFCVDESSSAVSLGNQDEEKEGDDGDDDDQKPSWLRNRRRVRE